MSLENIEGLVRVENLENDDMNDLCIELTHSVYKHEEIYGNFFTLEKYIDVDTDAAFNYLSDKNNIAEWSYGIREAELLNCTAKINQQTKVVDLFWTDSEGNQVIQDMLRLLAAQQPLQKNGVVLLWSSVINDSFSHPSLTTADHLPALRKIEIDNIKTILEHRHAEGKS